MPRLLESDFRLLASEKGAEEACRIIDDLITTKQVRPDELSIRRLAESFMGREWVQSLEPKSGRFTHASQLQEASPSAIAFSDFSHITGQLFFNTVKEGYELEKMPFSDVIATKPSDIQGMEIIPGMAQVGDEFTTVGEGDAYPAFGFSEDYQEIGKKVKRGGTVSVTKEAILGDKTGLVLKNARDLGKWLKFNKEKRLIDAVIDENAGAASAALGGHRYHWKGTSYGTYQTSSAAAPYYDNVTTSNALVDESDLENSWLTMGRITDPYTGETINPSVSHIIVTPQNQMTLFRILRSIQVRVHAGGYPVTGNPMETTSPSALQAIGLQGLQSLSSFLLEARAATDTDWWMADLNRAVAYFAIWDITPEEMPVNSQQSFERDIVTAHKISEMGCAGTLEPRVLGENQA